MNLSIKHIVGYALILLCLLSDASANETGLTIINGETFYGTLSSKDGVVEQVQTTYSLEHNDGNVMYAYWYARPQETWRVSTTHDALPQKIIRKQGENRMELTFWGDGRVELSGRWNGQDVRSTGHFAKNVTIESFLLTRTLNVNRSTKYVFDLLSDDSLPELKVHTMYVKVVGEETITVKAGTFQCKKLLYTLNDAFKSQFYKGYLYVTDDPHRYIVKTDNVPRGFAYELERIDYLLSVP